MTALIVAAFVLSLISLAVSLGVWLGVRAMFGKGSER